MIEYYLAKGLLLELRAATNVKLDSSAGSQSQSATGAYRKAINNPSLAFFVEANYTLLQTNLSLQQRFQTIIAEAAIDQTDRQEIGFLGKNFIFNSSSYVYS